MKMHSSCKVFLMLLVPLAGFRPGAQAADTTLIPTPAQSIRLPHPDYRSLEQLVMNQAISEKTVRLNPQAVSFVQQYMKKYTPAVLGIRDGGAAQFALMDEILSSYGLPTELKYLAVIESRLRNHAVSRAGAVGPWQFMPATARAYGLRVDRYRDERRDFVKSTHAAARFLKKLHGEYEDWLLVIAAYNCGPGYVNNAIRRSGSRNFWKLQHYLPAESRNHVKKFISTHYILEGGGSICTLTKEEATEQIGALAGYLYKRSLTAEELARASTTTIAGKYRAVVVAKYTRMDLHEFNRYNPDFDRVLDQGGQSYELTLPLAQMERFQANKFPILQESVQLILQSADLAAAPRKEDPILLP